MDTFVCACKTFPDKWCRRHSKQSSKEEWAEGFFCCTKPCRRHVIGFYSLLSLGQNSRIRCKGVFSSLPTFTPCSQKGSYMFASPPSSSVTPMCKRKAGLMLCGVDGLSTCFTVLLLATSPAYFRGFTLIALKEGTEGTTPDDYIGQFQVNKNRCSMEPLQTGRVCACWGNSHILVDLHA